MPKWTEAQRQAIEAKNDRLLVSAAAGSGKTAVLVERILTLIRRDGLDVERMLVVTFTRAAAAEMRERIAKALNEAADKEEGLREQALKADRAAISTLHVFCGQVVREYFQAAGIDPTARLVEGGEQEALFSAALREVLQKAYEEGKPGFTELAEQFEDKDIEAMVRDLYRFLMSLPAPWRWLHQRMADFPNAQELESHAWTREMLKSIHLQLEGSLDAARGLLQRMEDPFAEPSCEAVLLEDARQIALLANAAEQSAAALNAAWEAHAFPRFPVFRKAGPETKDWAAEVRDQRSKIREDIPRILQGACGDMPRAAQDIAHTRPALRALMRLAHKLYKRYAALKRDGNVYDFQDLEHKTLAVLQRPALREAVQSRFDAVFIDEYQDISGIQEAILQAVNSGRGLFMVGDVKQSIYRFRLADPTLFLQKYREAELSENAAFRRIPLNRNFRSVRTVIDGVNQVFESVMREDVTEIRYDAEARLIPGREPGNEGPAELHVLRPPLREEAPEEGEGEEPPGKVEREAAVAALRIRHLMGQQFADKETGALRPFRFRDIAVLLPKAVNTSRHVAEVLQKEGIPVYSEADEEYFGLPEITTMMALLKVLDNPLQDIPLLTTLKSPCFSLDEETLAVIRLSLSGRDIPFHAAFFHCARQQTGTGRLCAGIAEKLEEWRFLSQTLPLGKLLWQLLSKTGIYMRSGALPAGEKRQANLRLLCERAAAYEQAGNGGLSGFLAYGEDLKKAGDATSAKVLGETEDVVRIMTIHKSKGLEFPAVVVMGLGGGLHQAGRSSPLSLHRELGMAIPCIYPEDRIRTKTLAEKAIELKLRQEEKAERARLLYVAMTRARERLILIGTAPGKDPARVWAMMPGSYRIYKAGSMLDWIAQAVYPLPEACALRELGGDFSTASQENQLGNGTKCTVSTGFPQGAPPWEIRVWPDTDTGAVEKRIDFHSSVRRLMQPETSSAEPELARLLSAAQGEAVLRLPLKTSVTSLCKQRLLPGFLPDESEETQESKARPEELVLPLRLSPLPASPGFLVKKAVSAADLGTATHKALGFIPLAPLRGKHGEALSAAVSRGLDGLAERGLLTSAQREGLFVDWITGFLESSLGQRLLAAGKVQREWAFNLRYHAQPLTLVQGVIDCCFLEEGAWVLIDYKTDFVRDEKALFLRYEPQLRLYRRALTEITGIPVKEAVIFLLREARGSAPGTPA